MSDTPSKTETATILHVSVDASQSNAFSREIQERTDLTVITTDTVNEALHIFDTMDDVECIVSDYDIPDIDGLAFLQSVRAQNPSIPFILFTSEGNERVASKAITARVTDYLIKERFHDQWEELASLIEESISYHQSQRSLADHESRAKIILDAALDSIAIIQDDAVRYANERALDVFEVESLQTLAERVITDLISADFQEITTTSLDAIESGETRVDRLEVTVVGHEGTRTPVELTAVLINWNGSKAILLILRDLSEQKERQLELRRFKQAAEAAGHAVYITDIDGTIEYVNPAFESITGFAPEEAKGKNPRIMKSGEMSTGYYENLWNTILAGDVWEGEIINRRKTGELYHANQTIAPIIDADDGVQAFVAIQTDISDRVHQERELQEQKQHYESMFNSIRDAILVLGTDRRIRSCNPAFTEMFGYKPDVIEGEHTKHIFESEDEFETIERLIEDHADDPKYTTIVNYEKKSGQVFPGETSVYYLRDHEGELTGLLGLVRDVSGRRERITQLKIIGTVLRHNLNNEMNVIQGNAELISEETTGEVASWAKQIITTGDDLLKTVNKERRITDLLADPPSSTTIDLAESLDTLVSKIADSHPAANFSLNAPATCEVTAPPELVQGIQELIGNALEHSDREHPTVEVSLERQDGMVSVTVADDGPGIPEMEQKVLTGEEDIEPLYHGSGMGLWFVNLVVRRSDGVLKFAENEPRGSVVEIDLFTN